MILVTGASGFLGSEVVRHLAGGGIAVRGTGLEEMRAISGVEYRRSDLAEGSNLESICRDVDIVIHAAGLAHVFDPRAVDEGAFDRINRLGTRNMARAAAQAGASHFILISSVSVYGPSTRGSCSEIGPRNPIGPYARSKHRAEVEAQEVACKSGMAVTVLRLATLYGEGDPGNVGRLMRTIDAGRFIWIGDGSNMKSLLYKGDAARACLAVAARPGRGVQVYNVSAPPCAMRNIVDGLADALGRKPLPGRIPASVAMFAGKALSLVPHQGLSGVHGAIRKWLADDVYDTSLIERDLGFQPQVDLIEGLSRQVRWYRQMQRNV